MKDAVGIGIHRLCVGAALVGALGGQLACSSTPAKSANPGGGAGVGLGGVAGSLAGNGAAGTNVGAAGSGVVVPLEHFSFFVTSYAAMQRLSGSPDGFGGDLRYGQADGLSGADKICTEIAESSLAGSGAKGWRAFLSVTKDATGNPVNAIDRIGEGPWYDRLGRVVALTKADLLHDRPAGADTTIAQDLPNEAGVPNHAPDGTEVDNHDTLTGTNAQGQLYNADWSCTCHDWTSKVGADGRPRVGHTWPRVGRTGGGGRGGGGFGNVNSANWMSALDEAGCGAGVNIATGLADGPPNPANPVVGSGGGYGAIYCFALMP